MKIEYFWSEDGDFGTCDEMFVSNNDGKHIGSERVYSLCESPEDAIIGRSLISCKRIISWMRKAYEAGKNGEEFEVVESKSEE